MKRNVLCLPSKTMQALEAERDELLSRAEAAEAQASLLAGMRDAMEGAMQVRLNNVPCHL